MRSTKPSVSSLDIESSTDEDVRPDLGGYPYALNLMFSEEQKEKIMRAIRADSRFLE
jgi:hypothetical protein